MNVPILSISLTLLALINPKAIVLNDKDLFSNPNHITASWLGFLHSKSDEKLISNVPMFIYSDAQTGTAKIICVPKSPVLWNSKFKGKTKEQKALITKTLLTGIMNHTIGDKYFKIYALFQSPSVKSKANSAVQNYPSIVEIYKNDGTLWNKIEKTTISNVAQFRELQYDLAKDLK
ncbi:hypothetical protein [Pedobacter jejuensis]|uniref:Uncharacterized protein n=1 Tax=Pedobacter jejuensis TaxID=1268550 RepID=A0A3N0BST7_9SPHI|nr:hypothetical protein [Pedobacter jejuensis]RNL52159.1 hypothetical protein D7004_11275 [Pedobacter jejuensis]